MTGRCAGVLLHPTSLPGPHGIGELGPEAFSFADFLAEAGQRLWQVLPLGPTGYGDSPYQCFSAFAGNPLLISLQLLRDNGLLSASDLRNAPAFPAETVDYEQVTRLKIPLLRRAFAGARPHPAFDDFCARNAAWLDDYALFIALKETNGGEGTWTRWDPELAGRTPDALARWRERLCEAIDAQKFWQYLFYRQWNALRDYCHARRIRVMGDLPIYVAHDSADVWSHPELFCLDGTGNPAAVAGVPPDYFSASGQLWGNPIYRWDAMASDGYAWWIDRFRAAFETFDMVRVDHFRGFEAYWEVPAGEQTAIDGRWVTGPGAALFRAVESRLGKLAIVAENLGVITPEVEAIRNEFGFPGMSVLQFAFGNDPQAPTFKPHNYPRNLVAYTGTHDNDTTVGWWNSTGEGDSTRSAADIRAERSHTMDYLQTGGSEINWVFIRALMASVADTVLFPMQDILGLGSEARMNLPATASGNWRWRMRPGVLTPALAGRLRHLSELYDRL